MIIILESLSSEVVTSAAVNCSISYSNNSIYHLHGSLPALTSLPQVNDSVNETYAVTMHISLNEQRVTTLGHARCSARECSRTRARAPHVAAELRNPLRPRRPPNTMAAPTIHSLLLATMHTGRSLECSQIRNCSSGKLSKAFHTSTATVTAVSRELCFRKAKKNHNNNNLL